jgi:hypothetical protein
VTSSGLLAHKRQYLLFRLLITVAFCRSQSSFSVKRPLRRPRGLMSDPATPGPLFLFVVFLALCYFGALVWPIDLLAQIALNRVPLNQTAFSGVQKDAIAKVSLVQFRDAIS